MAIAYPLWRTLKLNVQTILKTIATEEAAVDPGRNFIVTRDRWRPWIEKQQEVPLVNIMCQAVNGVPERSGSRRNYLDSVNIFVDMYALGKGGETLPADEVAADRLDLLCNQVREGLTRLKEIDLGFPKDPIGGFLIDWDGNFDLTVYDQESEQSTGQYAPARWSFSVNMPYIPTDNNDYVDLEELNLKVTEDDLTLFETLFKYTP